MAEVTGTPPEQRDPRGRRVDIGLSLDAEGRFFIQGEPVTHERTHRALTRGLFRDETGHVCTRIGYEHSRVEVADAALLVRGVAFPEDGSLPFLALSDESAEPLEPETLWLEGERLYALVHGGTLAARFTPAAAADLLVRCLEGGEEHPVAVLGGREVDLRVSKRPGTAPAGGQ
jgi:hypothetical protein